MVGSPGDEAGATAAEYAVLLAFAAIVVAAGVGLYGVGLGGFIQRLANGLSAVLGG